MRNWELARSQRLAVPQTQRLQIEDFIALSREVGSGGQEIARRIGRHLNWPVFDRELLDIMAGNDTVRRQIYASMDERDIGWYEENLRALMQPEFVKNDYFHQLTKTILAMARQGHAVFLGRAADLIRPKVVGFRVRVIAPVELRIATYAKRHSLSAKEAKVAVEQLDDERNKFALRYFDMHADDACRCDLTINTACLSIDDAANLIAYTHRLSLTATVPPPP